MPHPWKMMKTISKTVSDKDLHIHYQLHPDFFHHSLATATRAPVIIQAASPYFKAPSRATLPPKTTAALAAAP